MKDRILSHLAGTLPMKEICGKIREDLGVRFRGLGFLLIPHLFVYSFIPYLLLSLIPLFINHLSYIKHC